MSIIIFSAILMPSYWSATPYTDTLTLIFPAITLYIFLCIQAKTRLLDKSVLAALLGLIIVIGYQIKPTTIITPIAIMIYIALRFIFSKRLSSFSIKNITPLLVSILSFGAFSVCILFLINTSGVLTFDFINSSEQKRPISHFIMMGLKESYRDYGQPLYGAYTYNDDLLTTVDKRPGMSNKIANKEIINRLKAYGVLGYLEYLNNKAIWIFSDGTFFSYGEGQQTNYLRTKPINKFIQNTLDKNGAYYKYSSNMLHSIWLAVLILICLSVLLIQKNVLSRYTYIYLSIVGIILFVLIFEGRSRYLFNYIPIFITAALCPLLFFNNKLNSEIKDT